MRTLVARAVGRRGRLRRALRVLCLAVALGGTLGACSTVHEGLGTSDEPCFSILPKAAQAVGSHGQFEGVRLMKVSAISYRVLIADIRSAGTVSGRVCLVDFSGRFTSAGVMAPEGRPAGRFAVVVLTYPKGVLVATVLFRRVPVRFAHTHLG